MDQLVNVLLAIDKDDTAFQAVSNGRPGHVGLSQLYGPSRHTSPR